MPKNPNLSSVDSKSDFTKLKRSVHLQSIIRELETPPKVSVILPVYGVEAYLEEALRSIQSQTLREIEIIPVNDMSPDGCQGIIDRMASHDPRIRPILMNQNVGQGFARNVGIKAARGDYIWFLDPDDYMPNINHLETVHAMAVRNGSDMVRGRKIWERVEDEDGNLLKWRKDPSEAFLGKAVECTTYAASPEILHSRHFWNWLYRTSFLKSNDILFLTRRWEERPFLLGALTSAKCISISLSEGSIYRIRPSSTARTDKCQLDFDCQIRNFAAVVNILKEKLAFNRDNPLRHHACFTLSQYLHYTFVGFPFKLIQEGMVSQTLKDLVETVAGILQGIDFLPDDLDETPIALSKSYIKARAYRLILAGVLTKKTYFVFIAAELGCVSQEIYYHELLEVPRTVEDQALTDALNAYARNDKIVSSATEQQAGPTRPRVIIHIGSTKTGSTYLQHLMEKSRPELLRRGIWYPEVGLFWQGSRPHKQAGHAQFTSAAVRTDPKLLSHIETGLSLMKGRIHTIILSSEVFFLNENAVRIPAYFAGYDVEMIVYLRRQDEWANSQYAEFVSGGAINRVSLSIEEWLEEPITRNRLDYLQTLERWERIVGCDQMHVRAYERNQMVGGDLITDFSTATGLPELAELPQPDIQLENRSTFAVPHISTIRLFNSRPFLRREAYFSFIQECSDKIAAWRSAQGLEIPKPNFLRAEQRREIMEVASEGNIKIARCYMGRSDGILFQSTPSMNDPEQVAIYGHEIDIFAEAYRRYGAPIDKEMRHKPVSILKHSMAEPALKAGEKMRLVNYGMYGWRLRFLTPFLRYQIETHGSLRIVQQFNENPADFLHLSKHERHRKIGSYFYPQGNLYGPVGIFFLWVPILEKVARTLRGEKVAHRIKANPIWYFRTHPTWQGRLLGRLLFPIGEIEPR